MKRREADFALRALLDPRQAMTCQLAGWDMLVRQARSAGLLARIGASLESAESDFRVPSGPAAHIRAEMVLARAQRTEVNREASLICRALAPLGIKVIFLKGAGYVLGDVPASAGRIFSDIDILVPKAALNQVEATLMVDGWGMTHHTEYDQHYYRAWMHELPPMQHMQRGTMLDIHHSILPQTSIHQPDPSKLIDNAVPVDGIPGAYVLAPVDMVLHSMTHLFFNEEFSHGLRDLSDLDLLLRGFAAQPSFWTELLTRARALGLERPLFYGLRYTARILEAPIPHDMASAAAAGAPPAALLPIMDALWDRALRTPHASTALPATAFALFLLYLRAHWMRMPFPMLIRHLAVKGWRRATEEEPLP